MKERVNEHAFRLIEKGIKNNSLESPLFFYGREQYLVQWAVSSIVKKYVNPATKDLDYSRVDGGTLTLATLINQCETLPLLSPRRVVWIEDFALLAGNQQRGFTEEDEKNLSIYLKQLPKSCLLIFTGETADKRRRIYKAIGEQGACYDFKELDEKLLRGFIVKRLKQSGKFAKSSVINQWILLSGYYDKETDYTLFNFENDIIKAIAYTDGEEIRTDDLQETISSNVETFIFSMIDALSENKKDEAFKLLHNLLISGENEYKLLSLICLQFETILMVKELKEEGRSFKDMHRILGIHEYRIKKAIPYSNRYSINQLYNILIKAYRVDHNIKKGILDGRLALELLIAEI